jgi:hypothetical protein
LEVLVGPVTRLRAKKFKEAFNRLLQDILDKVDFKRICNNKEQALINLMHKDWEKKTRFKQFDLSLLVWSNWSYISNFDVIPVELETKLPYLYNGI